MRLLSLDPSSTTTGWAVLTGLDREDLVEAGVVTPDDDKAAAMVRTRSMTPQVLGLIDEHKPNVILVESTSGKVNKKRHKGAGAGLATYGMAVGFMLASIEWYTGDCQPLPAIHAITENTWTRSVPKRSRAEAMAYRYAGYARAVAAGLDKDRDAADAIGLAVWWFTERMVAKAGGAS